LQKEFFDITERLQGTSVDDLSLPPVQQHEPKTEANQTFKMLNSPEFAPQPSHTEQRLAQFAAMLKDSKSDYFQGPNSKALKQEYFSLLGGEAPSNEPKMQIGNVQPDTPAPPASEPNVD